jgi:hypothetical protein
MTSDFQNWLNSTWLKLKDRTECNAYIALDMDDEQTLTLSEVGLQKGNPVDISYTRVRLSADASWGLWERNTSIAVEEVPLEVMRSQSWQVH